MDFKAARAAYEEGLALERVLANDRNNMETQLDLADTLRKIGSFEAGDRSRDEATGFAAATADFKESLEIARRFAASPDARAQNDIIGALVFLAHQSSTGDAIPLYKEAIAIMQRLDQEGRADDRMRDNIEFLKETVRNLDQCGKESCNSPSPKP